MGEINVGMFMPSDEATEKWGVAEKETHKILSQFQPTLVSEERRRDVINYVQRLLRGCLGCEVFPYGSVPLKTYLPDGDIDLTAFGGANGEDSLADHIVSVLEAEAGNTNSEFVVKDVQLVRAEVKLVKCIVQNIVVDISLNQIGGLCTLCFLEQVDRFIGKDHLFKQSIILIKAWCYYQSRILGAHHGLISTYALETLVLYIFHFFHTTLDGPLAVLYKFLDYFSKFDWETYCISLNGPVRISALSDLSTEIPQKGTHDLLLGNDFLRFCSEMFSVPIRGIEMNSRAFPPKYLNIVDPLKENNNLGRSVSKGNFYRIRSAFTFGAEKLGLILKSPADAIARELRMFFSSTLDRHGNGRRSDVEDSPPISTLRIIDFPVLADYENLDEHKVFLGNRVNGDAEDLAAAELEGLKISNERSKNFPSGDKEIVSPARMPPHAPHLYFTKEWLATGKIKDGDIDGKQSDNLEKDEVVASQGIPELNGSDLSGDYDSHFISLQHGRWWYEYSSSFGAVAVMPLPPHWDPLRQRFKRNGFSHVNVNPMFYPTIPMLPPPVVLGSEEMTKHRGIGTYFPNPILPPLGVSPSIMKGRNVGQPALRSPLTNNRAFAHVESTMHHEDPNDQSLGADIHPQYSLRRMLNPNANGFVPHPETIVAESGSIDSGPVSSRQPKSLRPQGSPAPTTRRPRFVPGPDRLTVKKTYHLKDEADFPPLSF